MPRPIHLLYALSGLLSLAYQVVWFRVYVDRFGSSTLTFALVLCNFIAGLGLGALFSKRLSDRVGRLFRTSDRLRIYGIVEVLIALAVLLTPLVGLLPADILGSFPYVEVDGVFQQSWAYRGLQLGMAILCVFLPCLLMGVTYPLLCSAFQGDKRFPSGLYAWNTLGACLGVLLCEFVLLRSIGHDLTLFAVVAVNVLLGLFAMTRGEAGLGELKGTAQLSGSVTSDESVAATQQSAGLLLTVAVLSGFAAGALEGDAFKRVELLGMIWNAAMSFVSFWAIVGIFLGSWMVRATSGWNLGRIRLLYLLALVYQVVLWHFAYDVRSAVFQPDLFHLWIFVGLFVLPPFLLISSLLPWACDQLHAGERHLGRAYGLNTLAFCAGLLVTTHLAPEVSVFYSLKLTPILFTIATIFLFLLREGRPVGKLLPLGAVGVALLAAYLVPGGFDSDMLAKDNPARLYGVSELRADAAHTTYVVDTPEGKILQFDSHAMSGTNLRSRSYMRLMAHMPLLAQEDPKRALLICFGVGNTAAAIAKHSTIERLDVVDLSREVMATAPAFAETNGRVFEDPRVRWINDDGRSWLSVCEERYDLITSEPPPPMNTGIYRLYSREYYEDCLEHLTPTGRMTQWLPTYQMPPDAVAMAIATFLEVFDDAFVFTGYDNELILVGGRTPFPFERLAFGLQREPGVFSDLRELGMNEPIQLFLRVMAMDADLRADYGDAGLISDQRNDLAHAIVASGAWAVVPFYPVGVRELLLSRGIQWPGRVEQALTDLSYLTYHVPDFPAESLLIIPAKQRAAVAWSGADWATFAYIRSLAMGAFQTGNFPQGLEYLDQLMGTMPQHPGLWYDRARGLAAMGRMPEARVAFEEVLRLDPGNKAVRAQLAAMGG